MPTVGFVETGLQRLRERTGQTLAEYSVILGVITLAVVGVFTALAGGISGAISTVTSNI